MPHRTGLLIASAMLASTSLAVAQEPNTGRITGRVLDALGEGVTAARVRLEASLEGSSITRRTVCDADGMFAFGNVPLPADPLYVRVVADAPKRCSGSSMVQLSRNAPQGWSSLRLWDAGDLRVHVVDEQDHPLAHAKVIATPHSSRLIGLVQPGVMETNADGDVHFDTVPLGGIDVVVRAEHCQLVFQTLWLKDQASMEIRLAAGEGQSLSVRVDGLPEGKEAQVTVYPYFTPGYSVVPGLGGRETTKAGRLLLTSLPDVEYHVWARLPGFVTEPREQIVRAHQVAREVIFTLRAIGSLRLHGVLRDGQGKPLEGETVRFRSFDSSVSALGSTDAEGHFALDSTVAAREKAIFEVIGGRLTLQQTKTEAHSGSYDARFMGQHECVVDPAIGYELVAIPAVTIRGIVVDADHHPVRGRRVELQEAQTDRSPLWIAVRSATTSADGQFEFRGAYPLPQLQRVSLGAQDSAASEPFRIDGTQPVGDIVITTVALGSIKGRVADAQGRPVVGARLWLRNWNPVTGQQIDGSVLEILSDREGRYQFVDVEPGGHRIEVYRLGKEPETITTAFEVESGAALQFNLELQD